MTAIRWYQTVHNLLGNCQQKQKNKLKSIDTMTQMSSDQRYVIPRLLLLESSIRVDLILHSLQF